MLQHGWQSWSATDTVVAGEHVDPSLAGSAPSLIRALHHADPNPARPGEVRSELVTVLADADGEVVIGFDGGDRHEGTFRLLGDELVAEAWLGGATGSTPE